MLRVCLSLLLACWTAGAALAEYEVVDWRDAARCVDRECGVRGTVVEVENSGPTIRLYFDAQDRSVRIILMRGWLVDWPPYLGRTIIANGKADRFRDHVEMILRDPESIAIIGGEPPATATPEPPAPTSAATAPAATPSAPPPTALPPTEVPPTAVPPTAVPPTAIPPTAAPPPAPPTSIPAEVEELRQRVRELEQRIEELEGR